MTNFKNEKDSLDIIYLYFSKVFDIVAHKRVIKKLEGYGILGKCFKMDCRGGGL